MNNGEHRYFYVVSIFLTVLNLFNFSVYASSSKEDENVENRVTHKHESQSLIAIKSILENDSRDLGSLEKSMSVFQQNSTSSLIVHRQEVNPLETDRTVRQNISGSKDGITKAKVKLEQINQQPVTNFQNSSNLGRITTLASLNTFLASKGIRVNWGQNANQIKNLVHNQHRSSPSFNASYSGTAPYSGYVDYSGTTSYSGSASEASWHCNGCGKDDNVWSGTDYCGKCAYRYTTGSGYHKTTRYVSYSGNTSYSGSQYYSGNTSYSGSHSVTCNQDHHACQCQDWAEMILSFRETLEEKDFYKRAYEQQKSQLDLSKDAYEEIKNVNTNLDTVETEANKALMVYNNERSDVDQILEKFGVMAQMASNVIKNRESYNAAIRDILIEKEEEQRKVNAKLEHNLTQLEKKKEEREKQIEQDRREQDKISYERLKEKDGNLEKAHEKIEKFLQERTSVEKEKAKVEKDLIEQKHNLEKEHINQQYSSEKNVLEAKNSLTLAETRVRSILKMIALNMEEPSKRKSYLDASKDKKLSVLDLLEKIEDYYS